MRCSYASLKSALVIQTSTHNEGVHKKLVGHPPVIWYNLNILTIED